MNIGQVKSLFRDYIDEADTTFITDANVALYCKIGYDQFRSVVNSYDLSFYQADYEFSLVDGELDLETTAPTDEAGKFLLGDPTNKPTKGQLASLVKIASVTAGNLLPAFYYSAAQDREELTVLADSFVMEGSVLRFSRKATDTIRIYYVPRATINFTEADATLIDNLTEFHDLIALYAYRSYAIRDGASNPQIEAQGKDRLAAFITYLERGRIIGAANHVGYVD